ncbi:hypothetical protein HPB50_002852 [Hyalomma asiaticum]|uniref:Uncharacterized protein n=1 Tax=Hyalomma asiaticum TaxID=266040 RepID=A0ACB7SDD3_HYAAI|nr:hypothetical protein HPB50_002852 [Hyalomma asiaticum]
MCGTASVTTKPYAGVTGSKEVTTVRWPWNVAIHTSSRFRPEQFCGGALITDQHVLTAAHCVEALAPSRPRKNTFGQAATLFLCSPGGESLHCRTALSEEEETNV